jgi:hypothetical protein
MPVMSMPMVRNVPCSGELHCFSLIKFLSLCYRRICLTRMIKECLYADVSLIRSCFIHSQTLHLD